MSKYTQDKGYIYYKNTNIPINKPNIRDLEILEEKERDLLLKGYNFFHKNLSESTIFDEKYFKELHAKTFNELYGFAGKYKEHPDPKQVDFFFGLLRECLDKGVITEESLRDEMSRNNIRHDALEVLERTPPLAA